MKLKKATVCAVLIVLVMICPAVAQEENNEEDNDQTPVEGAEIVVTAKRAAEDPFLSDRTVSILNRKALREAAPRTTPEALWDAPGAFVQETNFGGGSPIVRGLVGPQVLILVDGVRLNNSTYRTGPVQYLNLIDPYCIDRIEVLRGPGSVLYGSDAMGGVIQVFPVTPRDLRDPNRFGGGGTAAGRYSSADFGKKGHVHADIGYGPFGVLAGFSGGKTDNLIGGRDIGEQIHTGYEGSSAIGRVNLVFSDWKISTGYLFTEILDAGRTDKLFDKNSLQLYTNRNHLAYAKLEGNLRPIRTNAALTLSYQDFFERKKNLSVLDDYQTVAGAKRDDVEVSTLGSDLQIATDLVSGRLRLKYGGMYYGDRVGALGEAWDEESGGWDERTDKPYPDGSTYDNYGGYALIEGDPVFTDSGHVLRLGAGYRFHGMRGFSPEEDDLPEVDFSHQGHVFLGSLQYLYGSLFNAAFTFSQGFRSPNLQEAIQLGDTGKFFHIPNDELEPETADTFELVTRARWWRMEISVAGYLTRLHDLINRENTMWKGEQEIDGKPVVENVNGGEGILWGMEPELFFDVGWGFSLSGHMTYTWGEEDRLDGTTEPLTRIPPLYGQARLRYDTRPTGSWKAFVEAYCRGAGRQERLSPEDVADVRIPEGGTDAWLTYNVRVGLTLHDLIRLGLAVENLTDVEYKYHASGVYAPGTNAILTVELDF